MSLRIGFGICICNMLLVNMLSEDKYTWGLVIRKSYIGLITDY